MSTVASSGGGARQRRRLVADVKQSLRELAIEVSLLNHRVGAQAGLRDGDLACLDLVLRDGPLSPSALARRAGVHPATMTGILDRLERGRWVSRERDPADRRGVLVHARRDRIAELLELYAGMDRAMDDLCAGYSEEDLRLLADFLRRTAAAGRGATEALAGD